MDASSVKLLCRFNLRACAAALAATRDEADKCCATQRGIRFRRSQARTWPSRKMMSSKACDGRPCLQMTFMPCSVADGESCPALWACCMASRATATAAAKAAAAAAAGATRLRKRCMLTYAQEAHAMQPLLFDRRHNTSVISRRDCGLVPVEAVCARRLHVQRGERCTLAAAHTRCGGGVESCGRVAVLRKGFNG